MYSQTLVLSLSHNKYGDWCRIQIWTQWFFLWLYSSCTPPESLLFLVNFWLPRECESHVIIPSFNRHQLVMPDTGPKWARKMWSLPSRSLQSNVLVPSPDSVQELQKYTFQVHSSILLIGNYSQSGQRYGIFQELLCESQAAPSTAGTELYQRPDIYIILDSATYSGTLNKSLNLSDPVSSLTKLKKKKIFLFGHQWPLWREYVVITSKYTWYILHFCTQTSNYCFRH